jgi:hypothetical protein
MARLRALRKVLTETVDAAKNVADAPAIECRSLKRNVPRRMKRRCRWLLPNRRVAPRQQGRRRNGMKRAEVAGVDGVAAVADGDRALRRKRLQRQRQALPGR